MEVLLLLLMNGFAFRPVGFLGGGSVVHPYSGLYHRTKTFSGELTLWEDHGAHLDCFLCWPRALGQHERVHSTGAIGCRLEWIDGLADMVDPSPDDRLLS